MQFYIIPLNHCKQLINNEVLSNIFTNLSGNIFTILIGNFFAFLICLFDFSRSGNSLTFGFFQIFTSGWIVAPNFSRIALVNPSLFAYFNIFVLTFFSFPWFIYISESFKAIVPVEGVADFFICLPTNIVLVRITNPLEFFGAYSPKN